jgi:hypothetical protein
MEADLDFDFDITGFTIAEVDQLVEGLAPEEPGNPDDDRLPDPASVPSRCQLGDLWRLGPHRLVCGDARDAELVAALMDGEKAEMAFTDPPYNVAIEGNVSGLGKIRHAEFAMASGEMTPDEFTLLVGVLRHLGCQHGRRLDPLRLHGLAAHGRDAGGGKRELQGAQEPNRMGKGQRRDGSILSLTP